MTFKDYRHEASPLTAAQEVFAAALPFRSGAQETCALDEALGRTLYGDVISPLDMPPYHRAIVEGFLVHTRDTSAASEQSPITFTIVGVIQPGDDQYPSFNDGEAVEVVTGVVVPDGPYSVVRMWEAQRDDDRITVTRPFPPRFFIEDQGCDVKKDGVVLSAGTVVGPAEIGSAAALGIIELPVVRRPRVTVLSCGNEVIPYQQDLRPGLIRDSNTPMLCAAVETAGGASHGGGILRDDFDAVVSAMRAALAQSDMLVISGGTAAGGVDFIANAVRAVGELLVDGVPMRSGRPLIMGTSAGKPIVCVAGHPPEALRGFRLFGVAALDRLMGRERPLPADHA